MIILREMNTFITLNCHRWVVTIIRRWKCMNQNGKHISACIRDLVFNLQNFDFRFSRSSQSKHSLVV